MNRLIFIRISAYIFICLLMQCIPAVINGQIRAKGPVDSVVKTAVSGKTYALIIGISDYQHLPPLKYADKDAILFHRYLKETVNASDTGNLILLINQNVTNNTVVYTHLINLMNMMKEGDRFIFFFSGHGDMEQKIFLDRPLFLLSQAPSKNYLFSNALIDGSILIRIINAMSEKGVKSIFISDACRSGALAGGEEGRRNTSLSLQQVWNNEIKLLSCQMNQSSLEGDMWGGGRGVFSYFLLLGLKGLADKDKNGFTTLMELRDYLESQVSKSTQFNQIPFISGNPLSILSKIQPNQLQSALQEFSNNTSDISMADLNNNSQSSSKGGANYHNMSADLSELNDLVMKFRKSLDQGNLLEPQNECAKWWFGRIVDQAKNNPELINHLRIIFTDALQLKFNKLIAQIYNGKFENIGILEKFAIESELREALLITENYPYINQKIRASLLFLEACEATIDIVPNSTDYFASEKLMTAVDKLNQAIKLDDFSPYLYLRLGECYLYLSRFDESIEAFTYYQKLVPNLSGSYNKLGLAYNAKGEYSKAIENFKIAVLIDPNNYEALENLRILYKKIDNN